MLGNKQSFFSLSYYISGLFRLNLKPETMNLVHARYSLLYGGIGTSRFVYYYTTKQQNTENFGHLSCSEEFSNPLPQWCHRIWLAQDVP
jgi:hypothetical protein